MTSFLLAYIFMFFLPQYAPCYYICYKFMFQDYPIFWPESQHEQAFGSVIVANVQEENATDSIERNFIIRHRDVSLISSYSFSFTFSLFAFFLLCFILLCFISFNFNRFHGLFTTPRLLSF